VVLPQRGKDGWSNWGWSNSTQTAFTKGRHNLSITFERHNENMNGKVKQALMHNTRIIKFN
jgi:hypothetical protein